MKGIAFIFVLATVSASLFAGTPFEDKKKISDPFVADRGGGVNSLYVNPAGAAGESGFDLSVNAGVMSTVDTIRLATNILDLIQSGDLSTLDNLDGVKDDIKDVADTLVDLLGDDPDAISGFFDGVDVFNGFDWEGDDLEGRISDELENLDEGDFDQIIDNTEEVLTGEGGLFGSLKLSLDLMASFKTGFLIKGFGLGIYDTAMATGALSLDFQGVETVYNELGVVLGGGFSILDGKLALGLTGNYGILMKNSNPISFNNLTDIINGSINYGYTWGVDFGAVWRPTPTLGIGIVLNDIIGSAEVDTPRVASGGFVGLFTEEQAYFMKDVTYKITMDVDLGISWQPDWKFADVKFALDLYNIVGYGRAVADSGENFKAAMNRGLSHIRAGVSFTFFDFLKLGFQYHDHYISAGLGFDLFFIELYGEFRVREDAVTVASDFGAVPFVADLMFRLHF